MNSSKKRPLWNKQIIKNHMDLKCAMEMAHFSFNDWHKSSSFIVHSMNAIEQRWTEGAGTDLQIVLEMKTCVA